MKKFVIPLLATFALVIAPMAFTHALDLSVDAHTSVTSDNDMMRTNTKAGMRSDADFDMRGKFQDRRDDMMKEREERHDGKEDRMREGRGMMLDIREDRGMRFTERLSAHIDRLGQIAKKITVRAETENNITAKAEAAAATSDLAKAQASIDKAEAAIESAYTSLKAAIESNTKPKDAGAPELRADIKVELKAALDSIKSAHMHLKTAVEAFKKSDADRSASQTQ